MPHEVSYYLNYLIKLFCSCTFAYFIGTYIEYIFHRFVGHPPTYVARLFEVSPLWLKNPILEAQAGHDIHHHLTENNFYNQTPQTLSQLHYINTYLNQYPTLESHNQSTRYGMSFDIYSILSAFMLTFPLSILVLYLGKKFLLWYIIIPLPVIFITLTSRYIHPLIHCPYEELINSKNFIVRFVASSSYYKYIKKKHFLHHKTSGLVSYNLVPGFEQLMALVSLVWLRLKR